MAPDSVREATSVRGNDLPLVRWHAFPERCRIHRSLIYGNQWFAAAPDD